MERPTARVLCLPTAADVKEEAERMGVPPSALEPFAGPLATPMVKLKWVPPTIALALQRMISHPAGLALIAPVDDREAREHGDAKRGRECRFPNPDGGPATQDPGLGTSETPQSSGLSPQSSTVLVAGPKPLLLDVASRLEAGGGGVERAVAAELRTALERYEGRQLGTTKCGNLTLEWGKRTYVMGIINVTPDSFSGDGLGKNVDAALALAERFVQAGVDILDVGGESTRPGAAEVSVQEERERVVPVVRRLVKEFPVPVSVDSYRLLVVQEALDAGAHMVNDVWGLRRTEGLGSLAAAYDVPIVLMHNRQAVASKTELGGHFRQVEYLDLMGGIVQGLRESVEIALAGNVRWENIIVDPGIGFGKTPQQNLVVMRRLQEVRSLGRPILMGTSRKSVIGLTLGLPPEERVEGTGATVAVSICNGADIVRVHDVKEMVRVSRMTDAIVRT
ncbi:MAG: dihydropteroate synthase [Sphingomonadaceae bacterium]